LYTRAIDTCVVVTQSFTYSRSRSTAARLAAALAALAASRAAASSRGYSTDTPAPSQRATPGPVVGTVARAKTWSARPKSTSIV
jgi:hypothetical protein